MKILDTTSHFTLRTKGLMTTRQMICYVIIAVSVKILFMPNYVTIEKNSCSSLFEKVAYFVVLEYFARLTKLVLNTSELNSREV